MSRHLNTHLCFHSLGQNPELTRQWVLTYGNLNQSSCSVAQLRQAILKGIDTQCEWLWNNTYNSFWHEWTRCFFNQTQKDSPHINAEEYLELVDLSLKKGADLNAKRVHTCNLLQAALVNHDGWINQDPINNNAYQDILKGLIKRGIDINALDMHGESTLFLSLLTSDTQVVQLLLDHGADPKQCNLDNKLIKLLASSDAAYGFTHECMARIQSSQQRQELLQHPPSQTTIKAHHPRL